MQESAQAALTCIKSRAERLGMSLDFIRKRDLHIHIPEGAIPKDGPSAGITMAAAMASALMRVPVRKNVAMTGEITLRGRVLPIGGVKEKLLAAHRFGIDTIIMPKDNEKDLPEVPEEVRNALDINLVETIDEVIALALEEQAAEAPIADDPKTPPIWTTGAAARITNSGRAVKLFYPGLGFRFAVKHGSGTRISVPELLFSRNKEQSKWVNTKMQI